MAFDLASAKPIGTTEAPSASPASYDTPLDPGQERNYRAWMTNIGHTRERGFNVGPDYSGTDYDYRGFFKKNGPVKIGEGQHLTDEFKKPNHETFSTESMYATGADAARAGSWNGDTFVPPAKKGGGFDIATAKPVGKSEVAPVDPTHGSPAAAAGFGRGGRAPSPETMAAMRDNGLTRVVEGAVNDPAGTLEAGAAGFNRGVVNLVGLPADTAANMRDLVGMGYGVARSIASGRPADEFYSPIDRAREIGTGEWLANKLDAGTTALGLGPVTQNQTPNNPAARLAFNVGAAVPGALSARGVASNAAGGAAQSIVAEAGGDPAMQAVAGLTGGHAVPPTPRAPPRRMTPQELAGALQDPPQPPQPSPLTATGAPRQLPRTPEQQPQGPLTATGAPRVTPYTDLEGAAATRRPPQFVDETPVAHQGQQLPIGEQARRKDILRRVGVGELRNSAVQGDAKAASTDYQMSKLDNPQGQHLSRVINSERDAIGNFAERIVEETGGTRGTGQTENLQRGQNIVAPLDGIKDFFDAGIKKLYGIADKRAQGKPFDTKAVRSIVGDESEFLGTMEGEALLRGVKARMRSLKMTDADGTPQRTTVQQAERLKQYLGDQWTPRTSRLIKRLKEGIDDDVLSVAGEDVYARARSLRAERARILDDPNGIAKIMDAEGPQGINRAVAVERIGDVITTLPVAQFSHIVQTLNAAPPELRGPAQAALAEIKSQFANKVHEIGAKHATQWNARGVSKYLNDNSARLRVLFGEDELRKFADLNDAGHILRFDSSYPGAAVQAQNLKRAAAVEHTATALGGAAGSPFGILGAAGGAAVGRMAGAGIARRMNDKAGLKAARARTTDLRNEPQNALARPSRE